MRLKAAKKKFAQSKCIILHSLHKLHKKRARKTFIVQDDFKVKFHSHKLNPSLVHELLVVFGLSKLNSNWTTITNGVGNKPIKNANICPCDSAGFEHDFVH